MDIHELKSAWKKSGGSKKNHDELEQMTKINNHPKLSRVRLKLIIESVGLIVLLAFYYDMLDGNDKPIWLNALFITSIVLFIGNGITGYLTLLNPVQGKDIAKSLSKLKTRLKKIRLFSLLTSFVFALTLISFLTLDIQFTTSKFALLAGMIVTLGVMTYLSYNIWSSRLNQIEKSVSEFIGY